MLLTLLACTTEPNPGNLDDAELFTIGDSLMAWNQGDGSIPEVIGEALNRPMYNASVGGSNFLDGASDVIPEQYIAGDWDWLVLDGGANDLNDRCECGDCDDLMDEMLLADGLSGAMADFAAGVTAEGVKVMIMGYYVVPETAEFGFDQCMTLLPELSARQAALAESDPMIWFADASEVVTGDDLSMYDEDHVHPSLDGSVVVGDFLAEAISAAEGE
ncbi:MAG: acyl-CoA thioesterase-1 [Myxococcota bacterium]|jgi:acyl-CoA thioesterase-1